MFSCRDATHLHTEAREGALEGSRRTRYRIHMVICAACRRFRRQLDDAAALAREVAPEERMKEEAEECVVAAFRARRARRG